MCPALPVNGSLASQAQIGFVHERGGLESVTFAVTAEVVRGAPPELVVHERQQLLFRLGIPSRPCFEQACHFGFARPCRSHACTPLGSGHDTTEANLPRLVNSG